MEFSAEAKWLTNPKAPKGSATAFYKRFTFEKEVKRATMLVSAIGVYEAYINGIKADKTFMKPGCTSYKNRIMYQEIPVEIKDTEIEIAVEVAPGWAVGRAMYSKGAKTEELFSDHTAVIIEVKGEFADGTLFDFVSDESWKARSCEVVFSDIYDGETADFTTPVTEYGNAVVNNEEINLVKQVGKGVIEHERLNPIEVIITPKGETVIDFGQNMTGFIEFTYKGNYGDKISFTFAEVLDKDGNFYTENYRTAKNTVTYIADGQKRTFRPKFSFQGFRYIRLDESPSDFLNAVERICAVVLHTDMKRTGQFRCGNDKINRLYHNIIWGQKSNYLDIPTDCPQRDERLGWTGDAQVFCRTASYNYDVREFFKKWLGDLRLEQTKDGAVLGICPHLIDTNIYSTRVSAGWADCITIIPRELYRTYGDETFLEENFDAMCRWVEYVRNAGGNEYLWLGGYHYGDWLAMDEGMENSYVGATSNDLIASAFYANSVETVIKSGHILGKDVSKYEELLGKIKAEFKRYFMPNGEFSESYAFTENTPTGRKISDNVRKGLTQTGLTLILNFGLCEESEKAELSRKLDDLIEKNGGRMATGFLGTPYLLQTLTDNGYVKRAYDLFFQEENPSWLYSVNHGATTMWEHWNSIREDGSFWSADMNSFNHYAYGAVGAWMYETVAGIQPQKESAGFEKLLLSPIPDKRLGFVECSLETDIGTVESKWKYDGDTLRFDFKVPNGSEAEIRLPDGQNYFVGGGDHSYTCNDFVNRKGY